MRCNPTPLRETDLGLNLGGVAIRLLRLHGLFTQLPIRLFFAFPSHGFALSPISLEVRQSPGSLLSSRNTLRPDCQKQDKAFTRCVAFATCDAGWERGQGSSITNHGQHLIGLGDSSVKQFRKFCFTGINGQKHPTCPGSGRRMTITPTLFARVLFGGLDRDLTHFDHDCVGKAE